MVEAHAAVDPAEAHIDRLLHALSDATRRDIVRHTLRGEHSVSSLARRYPMSFAAVQKHVAVLHRAGIVSKQAKGREQLVRADIDAVRTVARLLDQYEAIWRGRMDRIDALLAEPEQGADP
ncbi:MAG: winged helix-turn-helix transcriptional regulator [Acidimicrobiales bacterium]|nr:winged helix-turn-helix transcriptional regulator [Acidimicrobiales bacterium]